MDFSALFQGFAAGGLLIGISERLSRMASAYIHSGSLPNKQSPAYLLHRKRVQSYTVFLCLLMFLMISWVVVSRDDYYASFGANRNMDEAALKRAFKRFALSHHPDLVGTHKQHLFILARERYEILLSTDRRLAYDRFGPEGVLWTSAQPDIEKIIMNGFLEDCDHYLVILFFAVISFVFRPRTGVLSIHLVLLSFIVLSHRSLVTHGLPTFIDTHFASVLPYKAVKWLKSALLAGFPIVEYLTAIWNRDDEPRTVLQGLVEATHFVGEQASALYELNLRQVRRRSTSGTFRNERY